MPRAWPIRALILVVGAYLLFFVFVGFQVYARGLPGTSLAAWPGPGPALATPPAAAPGATDQRQQADLLRQQQADLSLQEQKLTLWQKALEDRAKDVDQRSNDLEKLVSEITIGSSIYTLLLGLFAAFSLKEARDQASRSLDEIKKNAEEQTAGLKKEFADFQRQVEEQIPNLYGMQKSLGDLLNRIRREIRFSEIWTRAKPYKALSEEQRQTVLLAELTVASFDYFRLASAGDQKNIAAEIFAILANFYSARARVNENAYDQADLRRALLYMDRACEMDPENHRHLSQRAALIVSSGAKEGDPPSREDLDRAAKDLQQSLKIQPKFASALYNLAWVADEQGDPARAIDLLTQFINERESLPLLYRGKRLIAAYLNRACARARGLATESAQGKNVLLKEILEDCRAACKEAEQYGGMDYFIDSIQRNSRPGAELQPLELLAPKELANLRNGNCK
jgi:tetratricopeptide (TPR) repeat protein